MPEMIFSKRFAAGEEIFRTGDRGRNAYIIERGKVEVSVTRDGAVVVIAALGEGEIFGVVVGHAANLPVQARLRAAASRSRGRTCSCNRGSPAATTRSPIDGSPPAQVVITPPACSTIGISA